MKYPVYLKSIYLWFIFASVMVRADYSFQVVPGEAFDTVGTDVVWTNDPTQTGFPIDDDYELVNIGFTFNLGNASYTQVRILGNGALHFGADQGFHKDYSNEALPITGFVNGPGFEEASDRAILPYWDDLEPSLGGTVRYDTLGTAPNRRFVVSWEGVPRFGNAAASYSFQVVLYEDQTIRFRYGNDDVNGSSSTIGIEVDDTDFTQFSFNTTNAVSDANDILWTPALPVLTAAVADCSNTTRVTLTFDPGVYAFLGNDATQFSIDNGVSVLNATFINTTTVELTTTTLSSGITYNVSTVNPNQSVSFNLSTTSTTTFQDNFSSVSYNNNDGSGLWTTNWIESQDDGVPNGGNITITGNLLRMDDRPNTGGQPTIEREVDLSTFTTASFSFDLSTGNNLENGDQFEVAVSNNGGASYTVLQNFQNDVNASFSYDISAFMSVNTRVRFRITNNFGGNNERMEIDNVNITGTEITACVPSVDHFEILHDGSGINCLREAIAIRAVDASGVTVPDYTGTISLSTSTSHGNWFIVDSSSSSADPAQGTLTDTAGDDDGNATYTFDAGDLGTVTLYLENTHQESVNIALIDGLITDDDSEGLLTFRPFGFVISPTPVTTQIAGRPFNITLTAAGQTPSSPNCGVIEEYAGNQSLQFWSSYTLPNTGVTQVSVDGVAIATTEAAATAQTVTFALGVASVSVVYNDVGEISLQVKDDIGIGAPPLGSGSEIIGGLAPFVVRPFGYDIQIATNPYADDANDAVFTSAGNNFSMTLRSVLWEASDDTDNDGIPDPFIDTDSDAIPDTGGDLSNNGVTPNLSAITGSIVLSPTALVVTNSNGSLLTTSINFSSFPAPAAANAGSFTLNQSWSEVGILQLDALTNNFMSTGQNITGERINIGRFIPDTLLLNINGILPQCGSFTYGGFADGINAGLNKSGQLFSISGTITARNTSNNTTQNYQDGFAKLTSNDVIASAFNTTASSAATGTLNFAASPLNFSNGVSNFISASSHYQFDTLAAPFNLRVDIIATDSDAVTSGSVSSNAIEQRLGRFSLTTSYGPENEALEMPVFTQFFDGVEWRTNTLDACTSYLASNINFIAGTYTENLNPGETSATLPVVSQNLVNGVSSIGNGLIFSAPLIGNEGQVDVEYNLTSHPWLSFDWDGDNNNNPPQATLGFGRYRGSDRVIYWREN